MDDRARASREGEVLKEKYQLGERLGSGAMGEVYRARNLLVNRTVAIKLLHPELARNPMIVERFLREAKAANLVRHRNIVDVLDIDSDGRGASFIVQELLEGVDLATHIADRGGRLEAGEALELLLPIAEALGVAHARGLVHRDLKPENILLAEIDGQVVPKVLDFGISKLERPGSVDGRPMGSWGPGASPRLTAVAGAMGTPAYMSPEQIKDSGSVDARADVWALGVVLYEALSGELPFEAESLPELFAKICTEEPVPLDRRCPGLGREIVRVVRRALDPNPALRFENGATLAQALARARSPSDAPSPSGQPRSPARGAAEPWSAPRQSGAPPVTDPDGWELAVRTPSGRPRTPPPPPSGAPRGALAAPGAVSIPPGQIGDDGLLDWDEVIGVPRALELDDAVVPRAGSVPRAAALPSRTATESASQGAERFALSSDPPTSRRASGARGTAAGSSAPPRSQRALTGVRASAVAPVGALSRALLAGVLAATLAWLGPLLSPTGMAAAVQELRGWAAMPFAAAVVPGLFATVWLLVRAGRGPSAPLLFGALGLGVASVASAIAALALAAPGLVGPTARAVTLLAAPWAVIVAIGALGLHAWFWSRDLVGTTLGHGALRWGLRGSALAAAALAGWVGWQPRASLGQIAQTAQSPADVAVARSLGRVGIVTLGAERLVRAERARAAAPAIASSPRPSTETSAVATNRALDPRSGAAPTALRSTPP